MRQSWFADRAGRRRILSRLGLGVAAALVLAGAPPGAVAQKDYKQLRYPPLRDLRLPGVERFELPNGLVVYLVEDHTLPKVEGYVLVKTGARFEPADKVGLASILGQAMRTGGTTTRPGEEIDRVLENLGAGVETRVGTSSATASLFTLKENLPLGLEILGELLRDPAFPEDKIELAKVQQRTAIARRNDDVGDIANREFNKLLWGAASPYARHPEYETIKGVSRDDLVSFHRRYFHPNQTILGLWGDFQPAEVKALVEHSFGGWERGAGELPPLPEVSPEWQGSVNFIQKDDVNQTNLRLGHVGGRLDDPDYYALDVMAEILGGGLSSRLFRHVRSELGLAYAVGAGWSAQFDYPGSFWLFCNTKSESTVRAIEEMLKEVRGITAAPVTAEELRVAKEGLLNSFVFNFDTTGEIVRRLMTYEYYGYPRDFLEKFKANVEKVTAEDVLRAAEKRLQPDKLVILAVGRQQDFDQPLSALGAVRTIDISIPPPKVEAAAMPAATPESLARGRAVIQAALRGYGGWEALRGVRDLTTLSRVTQVTPQGEFTLTTKTFFQFFDKFRTDIVSPFGEFSMVWDGGAGWQKSPRGVGDMPGPLLESLRKRLARFVPLLLLEAGEGKRSVQHLDSKTEDGNEVDVVLVADQGGDQVQLTVEKKTGHVLREVYQTNAPTGPVEEEQVFSDFRAVGGLTVPFKMLTLQNGQKASESTVDSYEVNAGLDPTLFVREEPK